MSGKIERVSRLSALAPVARVLPAVRKVETDTGKEFAKVLAKAIEKENRKGS